MVCFQVRDEQHQCCLGNLTIPLSRLLASDDMTMNQRFQLSNSGPNSSLKMKVALRVLSSRGGHNGKALRCCSTGGTAMVSGRGGRWAWRAAWTAATWELREMTEAWTRLHQQQSVRGLEQPRDPLPAGECSCRFLYLARKACCRDQQSFLLRLHLQ